MRNIAPSEFCFTDGGLANFRPTGPRPAQHGASDPVRALSARIDALLATMPRQVAHKTAAPTTTPDQEPEIDANAIFEARRAACDGTTRKPEPATAENIFTTGAAAVFQARGQKS
jgi:hypothetical protein